MRYYISDLHFLHRNIELMDHRGFDNCMDLGDYMIEQWNSVVRSNDEVVILGDLSFGNGKETFDIINRLNGTLYLIEGNHDSRYLDDKDFSDMRFEWVSSYEELKDNRRKVILSHYPIICYNGQFHRNEETDEPKSHMLYGHVHNTYDEYLIHRYIKETRNTLRRAAGGRMIHTPCSMINTFCAFSNYKPLTLDQWIELDEKRRRMIDEFESECGGKLTSEQWDELNLKMIDISRREAW